MSRDLHHTVPAAERLEHHRKAAKALLRAARAGDPAALARLEDAPEAVRLANAQRAIPREHGHGRGLGSAGTSSARRRSPRARLRGLAPGTSPATRPPRRAPLRALSGGDEAALRRVRAHVPRARALGDAALAELATSADARLVIAREYGFPTWRGLVDGVREAQEGWERVRRHPERVAAALAAIRAGDAGALQRRSTASPGLDTTRSEPGGRCSARSLSRTCSGRGSARARRRSRLRRLLIERGASSTVRSTWRRALTGSSWSRSARGRRARGPREPRGTR